MSADSWASLPRIGQLPWEEDAAKPLPRDGVAPRRERRALAFPWVAVTKGGGEGVVDSLKMVQHITKVGKSLKGTMQAGQERITLLGQSQLQQVHPCGKDRQKDWVGGRDRPKRGAVAVVPPFRAHHGSSSW